MRFEYKITQIIKRNLLCACLSMTVFLSEGTTRTSRLDNVHYEIKRVVKKSIAVAVVFLQVNRVEQVTPFK
jgi:hypothetical protein